MFVRSANATRSLGAQVYFRELSSHELSGVGIAGGEINIRKNVPRNKIRNVPTKSPVDYIRPEFYVDMFGHKRLQLTPKIMDEAGLAVIIDELVTKIG